MANFVALFDACVLYPAPLRDLLMRLALTDLFRARWSSAIHDEWIRAVLASRPDLDKGLLERTRNKMDAAIGDALITSYEGLVPTLTLPDEDDRHVLAAAIRCQASVIVTFNLRDFPTPALAPYGIEAQHPDDFVAHLFDLAPGVVCGAVQAQRRALTQPSYTVDEMLETLLRQGLTRSVALLDAMRSVL